MEPEFRGGELYKYQEEKEENRLEIYVDHVMETRERSEGHWIFRQMGDPKGLKVPISAMYGPRGQKSVSIFETTDEAWAKVDRYWRDMCTIETYPLMESSEIAKIK